MKNIILPLALIPILISCKTQRPFEEPYNGNEMLAVHFSENKGKYTFYHATKGSDTLVFIAPIKLNKYPGRSISKVRPKGAKPIAKLDIDGKLIYFLFRVWDANHQHRVMVAAFEPGTDAEVYHSYSSFPYYLSSPKALIFEQDL